LTKREVGKSGSGVVGAWRRRKKKKAPAEIQVPGEPSPRQKLESLLPNGLGGDSEKSNAAYGGVRTANESDGGSSEPQPEGKKRESKRKAMDAESKRLLNRLKNQGLTLDRPTLNSDYWRPIPGSEEIWKPPEGDVYVEQNLKFRQKNGTVSLIKLNGAQAEYSRLCGKLNIVLKARQLGITSYIAARYFVQTITRPGTLTMLVAHDRVSAEEIFRIVQPGRMRLAEDRLNALEHSDVKRGVYDRIVTAAIAFVISAIIAMHDHLWPR